MTPAQAGTSDKHHYGKQTMAGLPGDDPAHGNNRYLRLERFTALVAAL